MTPQEKELLQAVADIKAEREEKRQIPTFSLSRWLIPRLRPENRAKWAENAQKLADAGRVRIGRTINDIYLELVEEEPQPEQMTLFQD